LSLTIAGRGAFVFSRRRASGKPPDVPTLFAFVVDA
jgi:hypothetical protein